MIEKYLKLNEQQKILVWLFLIGGIVFVGLCPVFFFYEAHGYSYPLGWLLGTIGEIVGFWTIMKMGDALLPENPSDGSNKTQVILYVIIRFAVYIIVLVLSAICTFKKEWFGGFDAFNFWLTFAGLLPAQAIAVIRSLRTKKAVIR